MRNLEQVEAYAIFEECQQMISTINSLKEKLETLRHNNSQLIENSIQKKEKSKIDAPICIPLSDWAESRCIISLLALKRIQKSGAKIHLSQSLYQKKVKTLQERIVELQNENTILHEELENEKKEAEEEKQFLRNFLSTHK